MGVGRDRILLSRLQEFLAVERGLKRSCQTLPLTVAMWLSFVVLIFSHGQAEESYQSAHLLQAAIEDARVPGSVNGSIADLTLHSITEVEEVLPWVEGALVPVLSAGGLQYGQVRMQQQQLGWARMSQLRGPNTSACLDLGPHMSQFHLGSCHPGAGAGAGLALAYGPHETDFAFRPESPESNRFEAWLEIGRSLQSVQQRAHFLQSNRWLDQSTQELVIEAVFLNSEAYIFSHLQILFKLHREGWLQVQLSVQPLRGDIYPHWSYALLDVIWILILLFILFLSISQMCAAWKRGLLRLYFEDPYVYVDWLSAFLGLALVSVYWIQLNQLESFESFFASLGDAPQWAANEAPDIRKVQATLENREYEQRLATEFSDFSRLSTFIEYHRLCSFWYVIVIVARYFRGFTGQPRLAVLVQTIFTTADFFLHYCIIFTTIFGNFALAGHVLFGEQLESWSTLGRATSRLFAVLFGEFDYNDFHGVAPITAACWFWFFYVSVVLVLMGVLSAAIVDVYAGVRERLGEPGASLLQQILEYVAEIWWFRTYEGSQRSIPDSVLLEMITGDTDPTEIERLGHLIVDRRLRTREDLAKAEEETVVDSAFLAERGCDQQTAERLLDRCGTWGQRLAITSSPSQRLMVLVARQIRHIRAEAANMRAKMRARNDAAVRTVDRLDLKHAKCAALARRIRKAQELPPGWTAMMDEHGRRYLRQDATGLTSWTLPRNLF